MKKKLSILFSVLLAVACVLFPNLKAEKAQAVVSKVSGNKIVLTALVPSNPTDFFRDDSDESTLVNSVARDTGGEYYSIVDSMFGEAFGYCDFMPSVDMLPFIENGLLYAKASAGVKTTDGTNVKISLTSGETSATVQTDFLGAGRTQLSTELMPITDIDAPIRFAFESFGEKAMHDFQLDEPTIYLYTQLKNGVTLDTQDQEVTPGQLVNIHAYNDVTQLTGASGNFMSFSKINHRIQFEFLSGAEYVDIVGTNLIIKRDAPATEIKFRVCSKKNSYSAEMVASDYVTLTVNTEKVNVVVSTHFDNFATPATFVGVGSYTPGKPITLTVKPNEGFIFKGWYINDELKSQKEKLFLTARQGDVIFADFARKITVSGLNVASRVYDGTTDLDLGQVFATFDGVLPGDQVALSGVQYRYAFADAGSQRIIATPNNMTLVGPDSGNYELATQTIPTSYGTITPRETVVTPTATQKQYGALDPQITFSATNLASGQTWETLASNGALSRAAGNSLGEYDVTIGTLQANNPNYNITLAQAEAKFKIVPREVSLKQIEVESKVYDGGLTAQIHALLENTLDGEDVYVEIDGEFLDAAVDVYKQAKIINAELKGADSGNYVLLPYTQPIFGNITPKEITVRATPCSFVYGDEMAFEYEVDGLIAPDVLSGSLSVADKHVGEHDIELGSLNNPNYTIKFETATCQIVKRKITVTAERQTKTYGKIDPELGYKTTNMVEGDVLLGALSRVEGEDVGTYSITQGDLTSPDYEIEFIGSVLEIERREIGVNITFLDKVYDGTDGVGFEVEFSNTISDPNAVFVPKIVAHLTSVNRGLAAVELDENLSEILGEGLKNYKFSYNLNNTQIVISRRDVEIVVANLSKTYGDPDPEFTYDAKNLVEGDVLFGTLGRNEGENVGYYSYYLDSLNNYSNPNYNISLVESHFEIKPREILLVVENYEKVFGEADQEFKFTSYYELPFGEKIDEVIGGFLSRKPGENVGVYEYDISTLIVGSNYHCTLMGNPSFIIKSRPVTVVGENARKTYGYDDPVFDYTVEGDLESEPLIIELWRERGEDVGEYKLICPKNDPLYHYDITFVEATLTIDPAPIGIKADENIKVYGDADPELNFIITSGVLQNNDQLASIVSGAFEREPGEKVGSYAIGRGTFSLGANYKIEFEPGYLKIVEREVTISALKQSKVYGEIDRALEYEILGELAFDDVVSGTMIRDPGEEVGFYTIHQGSLSLNDNYILHFVENIFEITQREIKIVPTNLSKQYGEEDGELTYDIEGDLVEGDVLSGSLERQHGIGTPEEIGRYKINCKLENKNYKIVLDDYYFEILAREIVIEADRVTIHYGEQEQGLTYRITSGTILAGDTIKGGLTRDPGNNAGEYNIISSLYINKNYNIVFKKQVVVILPLDITIQAANAQKTYGQNDPNFAFQVVGETALKQGDVLYGSIYRDEGEDVGVYNLISAVYNANYNITLLPATLTIVPKNVNLVATIYDKVYDGTTRATIRNPYISGLLDKDIRLQFEGDDYAQFVSKEVGNNIGVVLHGITLSGEKAQNYNLILPDNLTGNITNKQLSKSGVVVSTNDTTLYKGYSLSISTQNINNTDLKVKNQQSLLLVGIWLEKDNQPVVADGQFTISIKLTSKIYKNSNIYVYQKGEDGAINLVSSHKGENGEIVISTSGLGEFYITTSNEAWLDFGTYISAGLIVAILGVAFISIAIKRKKKNAQNKK